MSRILKLMNTKTDKEAFLGLVLKNRGIIIKICNSYCPNKNEREDLAQEITYQLWRSGKSFQPGQTFSTWMYRIALNVAISFYRKQRTGPQLSFPGGTIETGESPGTDELEENIRLLQKFINELKELDRALMLLYLESKNYKEIAEIAGITETNVATRISRAKEILKQKFATIQK